MMFDYRQLGTRIKIIRKKRGLSQANLAERVNRSAAYISYIENGYKCCSLETLIIIANTLNVSTDELLADCLENTIKFSNHEFSALLSDCSEYETRILLDIVQAAKSSLREHRHLLRAASKRIVW